MTGVAEAVEEDHCGGVGGCGCHDDGVEGAAWTSLGGDEGGKC